MKNRIKQVREIAGLTQVEYGKRLGVAGNTVTNYENGMRKPSNAIIIAICREFGISEKWLRTGNGDMFEDTKRTEEAENINERIKHLRILLHLSQETFAERIGLKGSAISHLENGRRGITRQNINSICREFDVNEEWLLTGNGDMFVFSGSEDIKESLIEYINSTDDTFTLNLFAAIAKRTQTERDILKLLLKDLLSFM